MTSQACRGPPLLPSGGVSWCACFLLALTSARASPSRGLVVPQAAVPGGAARRPHAVPFGERLLVGVVDAAGAPERRHPPLRALDPSPVRGILGAAGTGGGPGRCVYAGAPGPGRAVCVAPASRPGDGCSARS